MRKITKLLAVVLVLVMLATALTACSLIGSDLAKYRGVTAFTVGKESVTIGNVLDAYTNNAYKYYSYIQQGQMTHEQVFTNTMSELFQKYTMLDDYKTAEGTKIYTSTDNKYVSTNIANMQYLTEIEAEFVLTSVKNSIFTTLDSYVDSYITTEIGELGSVEEDTSRDFTEYVDMTEYDTYNEYAYFSAIDTTELDEYFADFYSISDFDQYEMEIDSYLYATTADAQAKVDSINERLAEATADGDEAPTITGEQYIEWQKLALDKFDMVLDTNYGTSISVYMNEQVGNTIVSLLNNKWSFELTKSIESDKTALVADLQTQFDAEKNAFVTGVNQNQDSYVSFITKLADTSYVYDVPALYQDKFIYVKNILVTFSDEQTAQLDNMAMILGGKDSDSYIKYREQLAASIVATDYNNDEAEVEGLFALDASDKITLNSSATDSTLYDTLTSANLDNEAFVGMMAQYNEDTASHKAKYDYVVYVDAPEGYTHSWVPEFVDAAIDAYKNGDGYSLCVSDYGVHIVYYSGNIEKWDSFDPAKLYDTDSNEFQLLVSYYNAQSSLIYAKTGEELDGTYLYGGKVVEAKGLAYLLEETGLEYDFESAITKDAE